MIFYETKIFNPTLLLALVSFSLYSCSDDSVTDTTQKNTLTPKISVPVAEEQDNTVVEPIIIKPR